MCDLMLKGKAANMEIRRVDAHAETNVPRPFEERQVLLGGRRVNYLKAGSGEKVVLLIHGGVNNDAISTWSKFNNSIEELSQKYTVFAPDLPGYGFSERLESCTHEAYVNFVKDFVDYVIGKKVNIVGTSMGGGIALGYALLNRDSVETAILISPSGFGLTLDRKSRLGVAIPNKLIEKTVGFLDRHEIFAERAFGILRNDDLEESAKKAVRWMHERPMRPAFLEYMRSEAITLKGLLRGRKVGLRTDYTEMMQSLNGTEVRLLFITGEHDMFVNKAVVESAISGVDCARMFMMEGCKHSPHFQESKKFNELVENFVEGRKLDNLKENK